MIENHTRWLEKHGIKLNTYQKDKLNGFLNLIFEWNKKINLTAAKTKEEIITRHILDSLMPITIGIEEEKQVLDLGSGGGFPAIPLAIMLEETEFILVEKVGKKCAFLNRAKRELGLKNITVENAVFEQLPSPIPSSMITRAVRIDKKMLKEMKKKNIKIYYGFFSEKPDTGLYYAYTLPGENRKRYVVKKEV